MDKILITGGAGFIGSHVARQLLASGSRVVILDNLDPFYDVRIKRRNLQALQATAPSGAFEFVEGDIRDAEACQAALRDATAVLHIAALAGVRPSIQDPVRYMDVNVTGTQTLLEALRRLPGPVPFVFASSSSVYGGSDKLPFRESDPVDRPVSPYAASKKAGEVVCAAFHHLWASPVTCLRFFTVYGPGQRPEMAIHKFSRAIVRGEPLPFFGDGTTRRDYTYVDDVVAGVVSALQRADGYRIYNLGGSHTTSLTELVQKLEKAFGKAAVLDRRPEQPGDVKQTYADVQLAERELGFRPRVGMDEGIERFARWYLAERAAGNVA
ncbi:MAG: SDR family NAD(P)-dependent oxidoreductase [Planctomycetota bacterium]